MGPVLYIINVNDVFESTKALQFVMYADDTCVYNSDDNGINNMQIVNTELGFVNERFRNNCMTLNACKKVLLLVFQNMNV